MVSETHGDFLCLHEFVTAAKRRLNANIWDYLVGGTETESTLRRNRLSIEAAALRPRVLNDVATVDIAAEFLGHRIALPVILAPIGSLESFHPEGGAAVARGAGAAGVPFMLSSVSQPGLEETAAAATGPRIFQLYVRGDRAWVDAVAERAAAAGYDAFCITVDTAHYSRRERDIAKRFNKTWRAVASGMEHQAALSWADVAHFKARHRIPLILKGIGTAEDAAIAAEHGVEMVYCSNHGGRQLDGGRGSLEVLPEVVEAVAGRAKVIVDGGFARGTDLVKAVALGADYVGLGRLFVYGLAAGGAAGVQRVVELLQDEATRALGLCGVTSFAGLTRGHVRMGAVAPALAGAFPLLAEGY